MSEIALNPAESIPGFYAGQSIFLTGVTGFLGKVFIEKVLRSCPDVSEIFLLMRPKKGLSVDERMEKILSLPLYDRVREERPLNFKKLIPVCGDVSVERLGLSPADWQMLCERTTIVVHAAASVRFNDSLKYAIFTNTRSTRDICILAKSMRNLKALLYVSTAYSQIDKSIVEEKTYPPFADWRQMIEIAETVDEHILNVFTAKCLNNIPNTYIFTKNLSEEIIREYSSSLPCAILRPSMVISSADEPFPGWIDNFYGPISFFISGGKGILRVVYLTSHISGDMIPVDFVIKAALITIWKLGSITFTSDPTPLVINCTNNNKRNISIQEFIRLGFHITREIPLEGIVWTPHTILTDNPRIYYLLTIFLHILPAILVDLILKLFGRQPMLIKLQRKIYVSILALGYFFCNEWKLNNDKYLALMNLIPSNDRKNFTFDFGAIDTKQYFKNSLIGSKKYLLHEDMDQLDKAEAHRKRVELFVMMFKIIVAIGVVWWIMG